ncbi:integrase [Enterococcus faecalis]
MAKTSNVYKDKKTGKYYFVASLGFDLKGKEYKNLSVDLRQQRRQKKLIISL